VIDVEDWAEIRRLHRAEGLGIKAIAPAAEDRAQHGATPFRLAAPQITAVVDDDASDTEVDDGGGPVTTRRVGGNGMISFATAKYKAGVWLAGQNVEVVCDGGLVHLQHRGVLIATHARRHPIDKQPTGLQRGVKIRPSRPSATAASVTRKVDSTGSVCFAGTTYRVGAKYRRR
jgi:hypothetical protein